MPSNLEILTSTDGRDSPIIEQVKRLVACWYGEHGGRAERDDAVEPIFALIIAELEGIHTAHELLRAAAVYLERPFLPTSWPDDAYCSLECEDAGGCIYDDLCIEVEEAPEWAKEWGYTK